VHHVPDNGYVKGYRIELRTWDGERICDLRVVSTWPLRGSAWSNSMTAYATSYEGRNYSGRGCGEGMLLRLRAAKT
jgi:hypothetical protein